MAEVEKFMGVSTGDIEKIMGVAVDDIETAVGLDWPASGPAYTGQTFVCFGGSNGSQWDLTIDYKSSTSDGNASDFGDMSEAVSHGSAVGGGGRGLHGGGGKSPSWDTGRNELEYVTIASTGNSTDAGDLTVARSEGPCSGGNGTRGIWSGGYASGYGDTMDYMTISSTGGASDFGNLTAARGLANGSGSLTRFLHSGGASGAQINIDYVAFDTTGDASDFGDLQDGTRSNAGGIATEARIINSAGGSI
jgi:hypothetical protein